MTYDGTISGLIKYLINRYFGEEYTNNKTFFASVRRTLIRMASDCKVDGKSLYDQLPTNDKGVKCMSIATFESHLYKRWWMYMRCKHRETCNMDKVEDDYERIIGHADDDPFWIRKADQIRKNCNTYLENGEDQSEDRDPNIVTDEELREKGLQLMIEGIFEAFYGKFDWESLKGDIYTSRCYSGEYSNETTPEIVDSVRAYYKQQKYVNYILKQK